jgi:single-stranded DNA-binding protein
MAGVNKVLLVGCIGSKGVEVRYGPSGQPVASLLLTYAETWADGKERNVYIPVEVLGKNAEHAAELEPGAAILVDGKVLRRRVGTSWETVVACWQLQPVTVPAVPVEEPV